MMPIMYLIYPLFDSRGKGGSRVIPGSGNMQLEDAALRISGLPFDEMGCKSNT